MNDHMNKHDDFQTNVTKYASISQVKSIQIYIALFTIQIVSKQLHSINQNNLTMFVYYWKKRHPRLVELINGINDWLFNLNIPN